MTHRCLSDGALARLLELPDDDARRAEAAACPRCDARLAALRAFLAGDPELPADELAAADRALAAFVAARFSSPPAPTAAGPRPARRATRPDWTRLTALASACAAVALTVLLVRTAGDPAPLGARLRGAPAAAGPAAIVVRQSGPAADGAIELSWPPVAGADRYVVELFTGDLDTLAVLPPLATPDVRLAPELLGTRGGAGEVLVRVVALAGQRRLAASPLRAVAAR